MTIIPIPVLGVRPQPPLFSNKWPTAPWIDWPEKGPGQAWWDQKVDIATGQGSPLAMYEAEALNLELPSSPSPLLLLSGLSRVPANPTTEALWHQITDSQSAFKTFPPSSWLPNSAYLISTPPQVTSLRQKCSPLARPGWATGSLGPETPAWAHLHTLRSGHQDPVRGKVC